LKANLVLTAAGVKEEELAPVAVVIDTLRATSTVITALDNGAPTVLPVADENKARQYARNLPRTLLGGERGGLPLPGFDLGNSPLEYTAAKIQNRPVILTTTNGTRAVERAQSASTILAAGLINCSAVSRKLEAVNQDVTIICAGTKERFSLEDFTTAGAILARLAAGTQLDVDDAGRAAAGLFLAHEQNLLELISSGEHARRLESLGFNLDILYCSKLDLTDTVPVLEQNYFVKAGVI